MPGCPSAARFGWALFDLALGADGSWFTRTCLVWPCCQWGEGNPKTFTASICHVLLLRASPPHSQPLLKGLAMAMAGLHRQSWHDGGNLRQEGSGWHCHTQHLRTHQQHSNPCPISTGLVWAVKNQIFREFSCRAPSAWTKCPPILQCLSDELEQLILETATDTSLAESSVFLFKPWPQT